MAIEVGSAVQVMTEGRRVFGHYFKQGDKCEVMRLDKRLLGPTLFLVKGPENLHQWLHLGDIAEVEGPRFI